MYKPCHISKFTCFLYLLFEYYFPQDTETNFFKCTIKQKICQKILCKSKKLNYINQLIKFHIKL